LIDADYNILCIRRPSNSLVCT